MKKFLLLLIVAAFISSAASQTRKALFDYTKNETAGQGDWIIDTHMPVPLPDQSTITPSTSDSYWLGAISAWGINLVKLGFTVHTLTSNYGITYGNASNPYDLSNYNVFIVCEPQSLFSAAEKTALKAFVQNGGGLMLVSDHSGSDRDNNGVDSPQVYDSLGVDSLFGVHFQSVGETNNNISGVETNVAAGSDPIIKGGFGTATSLSYHNGTTMVLHPSLNPNAAGHIWVNGAAQGSTQVVFATSRYGKGKVAFEGDSSPVDDGYGQSGNSLYTGWAEAGATDSTVFLNATLWLATVDSTSSSYTITATVGTNGTISPSGPVSVNTGGSQAFTITPSTGYHIDSVLVDGVNQSGASGQSTFTYTFSNVTANHTIRSVYAINQYTITASAGSNGLISPSGSVSVNYGANQTFTFTPSTNYHIDSVIVDGVRQATADSYQFSGVAANHTIRSVFAIDQYTIAASSGSGGSISPSGSVSVNYGANQTFTFTPSTNYHVDSVIVDGVRQATASSYQFSNVTLDHTIHVTFAIDQNTITASSGSNGSISPSGSVNVNYGASQRFTFAPSTGYQVDSVIVDGVKQTTAASYQFTNVTSAHAIRVTFAVAQFTVIATAGANGSISPGGTVNVPYGGSQLFTFTPSTGYHVDTVVVDGIRQTTATSYQLTNVTANHVIRATFAADQFSIAAASGPNGSISPSGTVTVNYGQSQQFVFTPASGFHVDSLVVDGVSQSSASSYTFSIVVASHTIRVTFAVNTYVITAGAGTGGSINPSGGISVSYNGSQGFSITPASGWHISDVVVDGLSVGAVASYTFNNVTAGHSITANFTISGYSITASAIGHGTISPSGPVGIDSGTDTTFTIVPNPGYHIDSVIVDGVSIGAVTSHTFPRVTSNHTISAYFSANTLNIAASAGSNGSISPSGDVSVPYDGSQEFSVVSAQGFHIDTLYLDGVSQPDVIGKESCNYTFTGITANHSISAVFGPNQFTIVATAGFNGDIAPSGTVLVTLDGSQSFTISPATGYHVDSLVIDGILRPAMTSVTFGTVTGNHTITVTFAPNRYTLSISDPVIGGSVGRQPELSSYLFGSAVQLIASPSPGYTFDRWSGGVPAGHEADNPLLITITGDMTVAAHFSLRVFDLATLGDHGIVSRSPDQAAYDSGTVVTLTAKPAAGYHFMAWIGDTVATGNPLSIFMNAAKSVTANFVIDTMTITASADGPGLVSPVGAFGVLFGHSVRLVFSPDSGYMAGAILIDNAPVPDSATGYTFDSVTVNHTIYVSFVPFAVNVGVHFRRGWNMSSLPVSVDDTRVQAVFPTMQLGAYHFQDQYVQTGNILSGVGYWVKIASEIDTIISGQPLPAISIPVDPGWNMIGSISGKILASSITADQPGLIMSKFYQYDGQYVESDTLSPGRAYWVKVKAGGTLGLSSAPGASRLVTSPRTARHR